MLHLTVANEEKELFRGEVNKITAPGTSGEFTVLPKHIPFLTTLKKGVITVGIAGKDTFFEIPPWRALFIFILSDVDKSDRSYAMRIFGFISFLFNITCNGLPYNNIPSPVKAEIISCSFFNSLMLTYVTCIFS